MVTEAWPSLTAMVVSAARGLTPLRRGGAPVDPHAGALLPEPVGSLVRALGASPAWLGRVQPALALASLGLFDHVALRTHAIDAAIEEAGPEITQLVVLGAGLDARATRLAKVAAWSVFEIDHPVTQAWKRARSPASPARHVPVDFERDDLGEALERAGHDAARPSFWVWEGVTMYLTPGATKATLAIVRDRSSPGSHLAMTYARPDLANFGRLGHRAVGPSFAVIGEPLRGLMTSEQAAATCDRFGFDVLRDTGSRDWADAAGAARPKLVVHERLALAERRRGENTGKSAAPG